MTIFDILSSLLFKKQRCSINTIEDEGVFVPFMVNRWVSMYSPDLALSSNKLNKYLSVFENKQELYGLFFNILPKVKQKRIQYFKKNKPTKEQTENNDIDLLARNFEISKREIQQYIDFSKK